MPSTGPEGGPPRPETESREPAQAHLKDALDELRAAREAGLADDGGEDADE
jgi:hypothetical protein